MFLMLSTYFPWMEIFVEIIVYWNKNNNIIGQSHDFWRAYQVASFVPEWSKVANDATRDTIIYAP